MRITTCNKHGAQPGASYVLYWMVMSRRARSNFALERAIFWAQKFNKPLLVLEPLRLGYEWASDRLHSFIIDGMAQNQRDFANSCVTYYPYIEQLPGSGRGLLEALAKDACVIVSDDFPSFFLPRMLKAAASRVGCLLEKVDSNGIIPLSATPTAFLTAYAFRRYLQKNITPYLEQFPLEEPLSNLSLPKLSALPANIEQNWPRASLELLKPGRSLGALKLDRSVAPNSKIQGGADQARLLLANFLSTKLGAYAQERSSPENDLSSGLSPYLHFGHISSQQIFTALVKHENWSIDKLSGPKAGKREGFWNMSPSGEAFLDQLITWRELGYNMCQHNPDTYDQYTSLPTWAQQTLDKHSTDKREWLYSLDQFERAETHDELWNAAQRELVWTGKMQNYLRMLWGKKILEWSASPWQALDIMIKLNNKYALDGRNPNSYSGIFWILGRYDRPWGPEREIFGTVRYMSSDNTARKFKLKSYLSRYSVAARQQELFKR